MCPFYNQTPKEILREGLSEGVFSPSYSFLVYFPSFLSLGCLSGMGEGRAVPRDKELGEE